MSRPAAIVGGFVLSLIGAGRVGLQSAGECGGIESGRGGTPHALTTPTKIAPAADKSRRRPPEHRPTVKRRRSSEAVERRAAGRAASRSAAIGTRWRAFGRLRLTIGYYIDALTVIMFAMVTLIASCIHFYAIGYMHDELHDVTDHEVTLSDGHICIATAASTASSSICRCFASACWGW